MTSGPTVDVTPDSPAGPEDDDKLSTGRIVAAIIFGLLALAFLIAGFIMLAVPADHLPGLLGHSKVHQRHALRGVGSILVGLALTVAGWFALRYRSLALEEARAADLAAEKAAAAGNTPAGKAGAATPADPAEKAKAEPAKQADTAGPAPDAEPASTESH